jgi:hypothetical protein
MHKRRHIFSNMLCSAVLASCRQYDLAWQYLDLGNRIMAVHTPHRHELEEHNLRHIKAIFRDPIISSGLQDDSAIFVVGMPRSGSTLVEQMLASHSQVRPLHTAFACLVGCKLRDGCQSYLRSAHASNRQHVGGADAGKSLSGETSTHCNRLQVERWMTIPTV